MTETPQAAEQSDVLDPDRPFAVRVTARIICPVTGAAWIVASVFRDNDLCELDDPIPDDTLRPLEEWNAKVEALLAECQLEEPAPDTDAETPR